MSYSPCLILKAVHAASSALAAQCSLIMLTMQPTDSLSAHAIVIEPQLLSLGDQLGDQLAR